MSKDFIALKELRWDGETLCIAFAYYSRNACIYKFWVENEVVFCSGLYSMHVATWIGYILRSTISKRSPPIREAYIGS